MSHTIHNTEGFILKSLNFGEANKYYFIFTKDFGLIRTSAQGVRHLKSKLRYGLIDFSLANIALVRGKETWRLTGVERKVDFKNIGPTDNEKFLLVSRVFSLLLRLLHGEEKNETIFNDIFYGLKFLSEEEMNKNDLANFECILALKVLSALGYIGSLGELNNFTISPYWNREMLTEMSKMRTRAILEINKSLKETHL